MRMLSAAAGALAVAPALCVASPLCDSIEGNKQFYAQVDEFGGFLQSRDKRLGELDAKLNAILDEVESGRITDDEAGRWFARLFDKQRIGDEPLHRDWINAYPKSRAALMAAAYDYMGRGFAARSSAFASKVSDSQFEAMRAEFDKAYPLFDRVDALGKPLSLTQSRRLDMRAHSGDLSPLAFEQGMRQAISRFPRSISLRLVWIRKSAPKWGGSLDKVAAVEQSLGSLPAAEQRHMRYVMAETIGDAFELAEDYDRAGQVYEQAAPLCPGFPNALTSAIRVHEKAKNYDALLRDCDEYLKRYPKGSWGFVKRGWAYSRKGDYDASFRDYEKAASLNYPSGLSGLAWFYETGHVVKQDLARALDLYQEAADRGEKEAGGHVERLKKKAAEARK